MRIVVTLSGAAYRDQRPERELVADGGLDALPDLETWDYRGVRAAVGVSGLIVVLLDNTWWRVSDRPDEAWHRCTIEARYA